MAKQVYIDESGDENLQLSLPNASTFYVVCALVFSPEELSEALPKFEEVRKRYFGRGEMKSSGLRDENRRQRILQDLMAVPFAIHLLVCNKSRVACKGLRFPKCFVKYLHGSLHKEVTKDYPGAVVRADKIKNRAFMDEMRAYLDRNDLIGLFDMQSFEFVDSKTDVLVQGADFIGGSVRACFERNPQTAMRDPVMNMLRWHIQYVQLFPDSYCHYVAKIPGFNEHDLDIEARAVHDAEQFVQKMDESDNLSEQFQVAAVRKLLSALAWSDGRWVSTNEMMKELNVIAPEPLSVQSFRSVIGKLRDGGLLIASRASWGYKIATSMADLYEFLNRQNSVLAPMIHRVRTARETVLRASDNKADMLAEPAFMNLKAAVDATPYWSEEVQAHPESTISIPPRSARQLIVPPGETFTDMPTAFTS